ncbi:PASTA domain-containing protein [Actinoplanes sp. NPDC051861]|uniref:PASTA domain-containing protein n=1 Tax=Actinoplanes sp. NPDC051861 TaxID=3155170 RepID=UPI00343571C6
MGNGIGGYDLTSRYDRIISFDFDHSGHMDHLAVYRPGTGIFWILRNVGGPHQFAAVYRSTSGIGGHSFTDPRDKVFAFDYDHSGLLDHLVVYRPGTGLISVLRNSNGVFSPVFQSNGGGIGTFDLRDDRDEAFAFDYDHSRKLDHIVIYRPGTGTIWILKNADGKFTPVYQQGDPGSGIGGYDLRRDNDRVIAFDFLRISRQDHLLLYRPGTGTVWILKNKDGVFSPVYQGGGIGGYDLASVRDRLYAIDFDFNGNMDHVLANRLGEDTLWVLAHSAERWFSPVYQTSESVHGIGGHPLGPGADYFTPFTFRPNRRRDHLVAYRTHSDGSSLAPETHIIRPSGRGFETVYTRRELTAVPYLLGYEDLAAAGAQVSVANLVPGKGFSDIQVGARIVGQVPEPGAMVPTGTSVDITLAVA